MSDEELLKQYKNFSDSELVIITSTIYGVYMLEKRSYDMAVSILISEGIKVFTDKLYIELEDKYFGLRKVCELRNISFNEQPLKDITLDNIIIELSSIFAKEKNYVIANYGNNDITKKVLDRRRQKYEEVVRKLRSEVITLTLN